MAEKNILTLLLTQSPRQLPQSPADDVIVKVDLSNYSQVANAPKARSLRNQFLVQLINLQHTVNFKPHNNYFLSLLKKQLFLNYGLLHTAVSIGPNSADLNNLVGSGTLRGATSIKWEPILLGEIFKNQIEGRSEKLEY
jgi:hypothetical protein